MEGLAAWRAAQAACARERLGGARRPTASVAGGAERRDREGDRGYEEEGGGPLGPFGLVGFKTK